MAYHPRENWIPQNRKRVYTRRDFLQRAALLGIALPALPSLLAACGRREGGATADLAVGTPASPVQQPLFDDNPAIESGLVAGGRPPPAVQLGGLHEPRAHPAWPRRRSESRSRRPPSSTRRKPWPGSRPARFNSMSGSRPHNVSRWLSRPRSSNLLNHEYLPNLDVNVWPQLADPYYDQGARYTVPYVTYTTGIGWRVDLADSAGHRGPGQPVGRLLEREVQRGDRDARLLHRCHTCRRCSTTE